MITDAIFLCLGLFFFWRGYCKGFVRTILGPLTLIFAMVLSYLYYEKTKNFFISTLIAILAPLTLKIIFSGFLKVWNKANNPKDNISFLSQCSGAFLSLIWGLAMSFLFLILISLLPIQSMNIHIYEDIHSSKIYSYLNKKVLPAIPSVGKFPTVLETLDNPKKMKEISSWEEYKAVSDDEKIKDIRSDEETIRQLNEKDFVKLLSNPKILAVYKDDELIKKLFLLQKKLLKNEEKNLSLLKISELGQTKEIKERINNLKERVYNKSD